MRPVWRNDAQHQGRVLRRQFQRNRTAVGDGEQGSMDIQPRLVAVRRLPEHRWLHLLIFFTVLRRAEIGTAILAGREPAQNCLHTTKCPIYDEKCIEFASCETRGADGCHGCISSCQISTGSEELCVHCIAEIRGEQGPFLDFHCMDCHVCDTAAGSVWMHGVVIAGLGRLR